MRRVLAVLAILAGLAGAVYAAFLIGFVAMMRGWSHVKDSAGDPWGYLLFSGGLLASGTAMRWGIRKLR